MADKIKGITVQIGGDTAPLSRALKNVDKEIRSTQSNLKEVNKLLKLDPSNTNLLKEKQKLLGDQIGKTKEKLDKLKQAQEQAKQMLANGEIGQKEYDELANQIDKCEGQLKDLEKQQAETTKAMSPNIDKISKGFKDAGTAIEDAGKKLAPFSAAAAAGLGVAVKTTADFDEEMSKVGAISGATGEDFDALRAKAREMGSETKFSATEAAQGFEYMAMAGWKTGDMLDGIEGILNLAAASGEDLGKTSDIVTDALTAMGYSAQDAGRLADVMAAASSNANTNVSMMGETFKYAAAVGGSYGYTMEDIALATGLMANAGIKGSQAGTAMRSIMTRLATDAGASSKKLGALGVLTEKLGVAFYNTDGTMRPFRSVIEDVRKKWGKLTKEEQANYANTIAGKNAMTGWLAIMNSAEEDFDKLADAIDNSNGTAKGMADTMQDNLAGQLTILKSQLQEFAISIGDALMPAIRDVVSWFQGLVDKFNALSPKTKEMVAKIGVLVAALAPLLMVGGKLVSGIGSIIGMVPKITTFLSGIGGPIALATAAVAGLVAVIVNWKTAEDEIFERRSKLTEEQEALKKKVDEEAESWENVKKAREDAYKDIKTQTDKEKELWDALKKVVDEQGNVINGKENEAKVLIDQLNGALGTELELVDGQVKGYEDLAKNIDTVLAKKEAEALLAADQEAYTEARNKRAEAEDAVADAQAEVAKQEEAVRQAEARLAVAMDESSKAARSYADDKGMTAEATHDWEDAISGAKTALDAEKKQLEDVKKIQQTAEKTLDNYNATISNHGNLMKAVANGSVEDMRKAEKDLLNDTLTAEAGTKESLQRQYEDRKKAYQDRLEILEKTGTEEAKTSAKNAKQLVLDTITEINKLDPKLASEMAKDLKTITSQSTAWSNAGKASGSSYKTSFTDALHGFSGVLKDKLDMSSQAATWGKDMMSSYAGSIRKNATLVKEAANDAASQVHKVLGFSEPEEGPLSDFHTYGPDMMQLLAKGIKDSQWQVLQAAQGVAGNLKASLEGTRLTAQLDQKSIPLGTGVTLNITNFNNYSDSDIRELTNEIMQTAQQFANRKGAAFA